MAGRRSLSTIIGTRVPRPRLVSRLILLRTPPGRCRAQFAMFRDPVATPTRPAPSPKLVLTLGLLKLRITVNAAIATAAKLAQTGSKVSPTVHDLVPAPWVSLVRIFPSFVLFLPAQLSSIHHTSMTIICITQLGAICDRPRCTCLLSHFYGGVLSVSSFLVIFSLSFSSPPYP